MKGILKQGCLALFAVGTLSVNACKADNKPQKKLR